VQLELILEKVAHGIFDRRYDGGRTHVGSGSFT
jgi:hypothetical protein